MNDLDVRALRSILNGIIGLAAAADAILDRATPPEVQVEEMPQPAGPRWLGDDSPRIGA